MAAAAGGSWVIHDQIALGQAQRTAVSDGVGVATVPFYGPHQPGIAAGGQATAVFAAFDLHTDTDRAALGRLMRILTDDISRMMAGRPPLADTSAALAATPARLSVTIGYGPGLFSKTGLTARQPAGFVPLPAFAQIDALESAYSDGDLLLHIASDDPVTTSHSLRMLLKDTRAFAAPLWFQRGFRNARGSAADGVSTRNLMGQVDGTVNPTTAVEMDRIVWHQGPGWFTGGTTLVLRRIRMNLDTWDALAPAEMEEAIGRNLVNGAPLTGTQEHDDPDFTKPDASGLTAIAPFAHIRLARGNGPAPSILRRPFNFDDSPDADGKTDAGLLFAAYQASISEQFLPIQRRLAQGDLLNQWTTPVGSAVFAIPPGCQPGGWIGEGLLA